MCSIQLLFGLPTTMCGLPTDSVCSLQRLCPPRNPCVCSLQPLFMLHAAPRVLHITPCLLAPPMCFSLQPLCAPSSLCALPTAAVRVPYSLSVLPRAPWVLPTAHCVLPTAGVSSLQPCVLPTPVGALGLLRYSCLFFLCLSQTG